MTAQTPGRRSLGSGATSIIAISLLAFACLSRQVLAEDVNTIKIDNFTFAPATLTFPLGATATWENGDDIPHSIVIADLKIRSKPLDTGEKYSFTFSTAGTFEYFCGLHPHMKGMIVVTP